MTSARRIALLLLLSGLSLLGVLWLGETQSWHPPRWLRGVLAGGGGAMLCAALMLWWLPDPFGLDTPRLRRQLLRGVLLAMSAFVLADIAADRLLAQIASPAWLRAAIALAPMVPIAWAFLVMVRYVRSLDELQQRLELQALGLATAVTMLLQFAGVMLQQAGVIDIPGRTAMLLALAVVATAYGVCRIVLTRRYR